MAQQVNSKVLVGTALTAVIAAPASAQEQLFRAPATVSPWSGWYLGAGVSIDALSGSLYGYGSDVYCEKYCDYPNLENTTPVKDHKFNAEFEIGIDRETHNGFVLGAAASIGLNFGALHGSDSYSGKYYGSYDTYDTQIDYFGEIKNTASLVARVGKTVGHNALIYVLAGGTVAQYRVGGYFDAGLGSFEWDKSGVTRGFTVGVGFEKFIGARTTFKLEARYTNLVGVEAHYDNYPQYGQVRFDPDLYSLLAKLTYRFKQ